MKSLCLMNSYFFIIMIVNKSGQVAAIMSSASGVNGLSSCYRMGAYSKGALNAIKL